MKEQMTRGLRERIVVAAFAVSCSLFLALDGDGDFFVLALLPLSRSVTQRRVVYRGQTVVRLPVSLDKSNEPLIPEDNPYADGTAVSSLSGVRFSSVLSGLNRLFPPEELSQRNALSRTDGYWPYIQKGADPPEHLTYGEFDFYFFAELLDRAHFHYSQAHQQQQPTLESDWTDKVFVDIGSGTGRLVLSAASLHPTWRLCRGIELLPTIHDAAKENLEKCRRHQAPDDDSDFALETDDSDLLHMAPIDFVCGSADDPYVYFGDADCIFIFSTCMSEEIRASIAEAIGRQCKPGTIVITTDYLLPLEGNIPSVEKDDRFRNGPYRLELAEKKEGYCWLTQGASTAYIHQVVGSLWQEGDEPLERPIPSVEDVAFETAMALESGELTDTEAFLRGVSNNIIFHGLPDSFRPNANDD